MVQQGDAKWVCHDGSPGPDSGRLRPGEMKSQQARYEQFGCPVGRSPGWKQYRPGFSAGIGSVTAMSGSGGKEIGADADGQVGGGEKSQDTGQAITQISRLRQAG